MKELLNPVEQQGSTYEKAQRAADFRRSASMESQTSRCV